MDGLTAKPFWDVTTEEDLFPWANDLEANAHVIQEEFESNLKESKMFSADSVWQNQVRRDWMSKGAGG